MICSRYGRVQINKKKKRKKDIKIKLCYMGKRKNQVFPIFILKLASKFGEIYKRKKK